MKWGLWALGLLAGCGTESQGDQRLVGDWVSMGPVGTLSVELGVRPFGAGYTRGTFVMTSGSSANLQTDDGRYGETDTSITFTPTTSSCPSPVASTETYAFQGANLALSGPDGTTVFAPFAGPPPTLGLTLTIGCFDSNGNFTPHALGPVANEP